MEIATQRTVEFNVKVRMAVERTIVEVLGVQALESTVEILRDKYDISRDEMPYRMETVYRVLEDSFGVFGAKTLGSAIARKLYASLGLDFQNHDGYLLSDYAESAKSLLH